MTDRELLELAAKAARIDLQHRKEEPGHYVADTDGPYWVYWNPLDYDGDALRLAVKLHLAVNWTTCFVQVGYAQEEYAEGEDASPAVRRAIVRAAAEIGKELK